MYLVRARPISELGNEVRNAGEGEVRGVANIRRVSAAQGGAPCGWLSPIERMRGLSGRHPRGHTARPKPLGNATAGAPGTTQNKNC